MLKDIFKLGIAVRSLSLASMLSKYSFPELEIALKSSNSLETPCAIAPPLLMLTGASLNKIVSIFKITSEQSKMLFPKALMELFLLSNAFSLIGKIACKEFFNKTVSLGETFPVASFEIKRSMSLICCN